MRPAALLVALAAILAPFPAAAEDPPCPPPYKVCLTEEQHGKVVEAVRELHDIKNNPAKVEFKEPVVIVRDWEGRVYVNGGDKRPVPVKLTIGKTVDRDLEMILPVRIYEREEPEEPLFSVRWRFQFGVMPIEIGRTILEEELDEFWYAGIDLDFFHYDIFNVSLHAGTQGVGGGLGLDVTKNMGVSVGAVVQWADWTPGLLSGVYFGF